MSDLTPIPAEQRRIYHEALRAGLAEAERRGLELDALPFAAFHRALYRPMIDAARADERAKTAEGIADRLDNEVRRAKADDGVYVSDHTRGIQHAAAIARQHANGMPSADVEGRTGADASDATPDGPKAAQTLSDGRDGSGT